MRERAYEKNNLKNVIVTCLIRARTYVHSQKVD